MTVRFKNKSLEDLYKPGGELGKQPFSKDVIVAFRKKIDILKNLDSIGDLSQFKGLRFEKLKGEYKGSCSIRVNKQYRIIFTEGPEGEVSVLILELSKHYE